jgi:thiol-disulfide isomerase/thioredoxin
MRWLTHRYALRGALVLLALVLLAASLLAHGPRARKVAPMLPRRTLSGKSTSLSALRGRAAVVLFWAPWCLPCQAEAPAVEAFARSRAGRGHIVTVDVDNTSHWRAFVRKYHWTMPVLADPTFASANAYDIPGLPTSVFLDPSGRISSTSPGPQTLTSLTNGLDAAA